MNKTVIGVFTDKNNAEKAISELEENNYDPKEISIVMKGEERGEEAARERSTHAGSGIATGVTAGGIIGALAGLVVGAGIIPGLGALFIGGPLVAALGLSGMAAATAAGATTGALAGGIVGLLSGMGVAAKDIATYEKRIREGGVLLAVPARSGEEKNVEEILEKYDADNIRSIEQNEVSRHRSAHHGVRQSACG